MNTIAIFAEYSFWMIGLPIPVALAAIALVGYLAGSRRRRDLEFLRNQSRGDLKRAKRVFRQLDGITQELRQSLARHHASILQFKDRVSELNGLRDPKAGEEFCQEAEKLIKPTLDLGSHISHTYNELRHLTNELMLFTDVLTDPLTGLSNRKALEASLKGLLALMTRYDNKFSVAVIEIDHFHETYENQGDEKERHGDQILQQVGLIIDGCVRDTDILARCDGGEFVVVMPETELRGACIFGSRLRQSVEKETCVTISGGLSMVLDGDSIRTLLARADSALYSAKAAGHNCVYLHDGEMIQPLSTELEEPDSNPSNGKPVELSPATSVEDIH